MIRQYCHWVIALVSIAGAIHAGDSDKPAAPPDGATVLFDGKDTSAFVAKKGGGPCPWKIVDGAIESGTDDIVTKEKYKDFKMHAEFWIPKYPPEVTGQNRGNSGIKLQERYEIQVLDSYGLTPGKQDCAAVYLQKPPDKNMCTPPETWQTYDITFKAARYGDDKKKTENARVTVIHNGTKVQDDVEITGKTGASAPEGPDAAPLLLQWHHCPVRFRNVWILPVTEKK